MGFESAYAIGLAWRLLLVLLAGSGVAALALAGGYRAALLVAVGLAAATLIGLWRYLTRTNVEVARFVDAVKFGDLAQVFTPRRRGGGFDELGAALDGAIRRLREERAAAAAESRFNAALVEAAPVALLAVGSDGRIDLANQAARQLFGAPGVRAADFARFGPDLAALLAAPDPPPRTRIGLVVDDAPRPAIAQVARLLRLGGEARVVAVQPIERELGDVELRTQAELIRVLTHEIMNSITPVTSLARTAVEELRQLAAKGVEGVGDALAATETVARRAEGILHFVETYRQISRAPAIRRRSFAVRPWAQELVRLAAADARGVTFDLSVDPETLTLDADPDLMAQVFLNLLRNAAEAACEHAARPAVSLAAARSPGGGAVRLEVADNGPGVPETREREIFLPFYTTKPNGTGVGLSLARQIVLAHEGTIQVTASASGGALFRIQL